MLNINERHANKYKNKIKQEVAEIRKEIVDLSLHTNEQLLKLFNHEQTEDRPLRKKLVRVYAIATIMIERLLDLKLYDVQLQGAIALFDGKIAEMKTGEGKTITSALPIILNALSGKPVHVVTVNEYLSKRDKEELEPLYKFFNFTVALNLNSTSGVEKQNAYNCDILYSTANELGFDYLRDNMAQTQLSKLNQRGYNTVLIDEIDLILIDEARTPLIIGNPKKDNIVEILQAQNFVSNLTSDDYTVSIKDRSVVLTEKGEEKANLFYKTENIYSDEMVPVLFRLSQALIANFIYKKEVDYTVLVDKKEKEVVIIDTFTGRKQFGRRFSYSLHQALEAKHNKEGVKVKKETQTVATITLQNFFRMYNKVSGMSGTAHEEFKEFMEIYGLDVIKIDTNKPFNREDKEIVAFKTKEEKWGHILDRITSIHSTRCPILVGTVSVEDSELLSKMLRVLKIPHAVLNAKQDKYEAEVIAKAGKPGAITIATNMAGRGTDIKTTPDYPLYVLVTELNESSRIDNQLKGRTSRQGEKGYTETIISLEDTIFEKTNVSSLKKIKVTAPLPKIFNKVLKQIQTELENSAYSARSNALKYDDVIREQRTIFYNSRDAILTSNQEKLENILVELTNIESLEMLNNIAVSDNNKTDLLRSILLQAMDSSWVSHIAKLDALKNGISWRSQNGSNPIITYQNEASLLYDDFLKNIKTSIIEMLKTVDHTFKTKNVYGD